MEDALHYWVSTVDSDGNPHSTPVDGLWIDNQLYFGGSVKTRRHRNLLRNPGVCVHLESAMNVVILRGHAEELRDADSSVTQRLAAGSKKKYGYSPPPEAFVAGGVWVFRPTLALAWTQFPKDATRWKFTERD
jgi:nitroimidazol reductase NimA-like FMN-containing flavoprotein (pyridoxamine 5'-phosphate oxidase superfamily)